ncbi:MAG TPA: cation:proton antiporter [Candidatus Baltobacteraceae bacterium]
MKLWQIAVLLIAGIGVGVAFPGRLTGLFGTVTLYVFLPALIFEAAWQLDLRVMRQVWRPIVLLAFPGVLVTAAIVGAATHVAGALPWRVALLLGAVLSATDPVAVVAIFRQLVVPKTLATIVESEALLNDAVAVVVYRVILMTFAIGATAAGTVQIAAGAVLGTAFGIGLGVVAAFVTSLILRRGIGAVAQTGLTFVAAYGAYFAADRLQWSGIFAVVSLGIVLRALETRHDVVRRADGVERAWSIAAAAANAVLFFLVGAALDVTRLLHAPLVILLTLLAVAAARILLAYGGLALVRPRLDLRWKTVVRLAGVRGALSLALALATPLAIEQRPIIIDATFAVVLVTVLVSSFTIEPRVRELGLDA